MRRINGTTGVSRDERRRCLIVTLAEVYPRAMILTLLVRHFWFFRRFQHEALQLLTPL
jgi:hypothetical protein